MNDITDQEIKESKSEDREVRPLDKQSRVALFVYCNSYKGNRQLGHYGDLSYTSRKAHYSLLYVNEEEAETTIKKLKELKFVKRVRRGHLNDLNKNFSEAFAETNAEIKGQLEAALAKL
ncbi:YlbG family protein [Lactococcus garvieae]|uniref:Uncharacterized protein n=1 Tax=Lactococcus garvieae DCC43 TaxID=1231377 RepID=K2PUC1_9LACT|nr:YlbG family protein [Lactococcus garvieae]EKF51051.1 hypothetical protein C426_1588 [Lactococcus garvieae DCC43]